MLTQNAKAHSEFFRRLIATGTIEDVLSNV